MTGNANHARRAVRCATAAVACSILAGCGDDRKARTVFDPPGATIPSPIPTPPSLPRYAATPRPFNVTQNQAFDILGWDSWHIAPTPSAIQLRWNAAIDKYEVLAPGDGDWSRLEVLEDLQFGGTPHEYDVFGDSGTKLPFQMILWAPPHRSPVGGYVGNGRIWDRSVSRTVFAFGIATEPRDVPVSGTMTCSVGEDEIGVGHLTFDLAAGNVSGWVEPFWANVRYQLTQTRFGPGATTFAATFGTDGVLEGRFFGPGAVNLAVRVNGGGTGFAAVRGIMTGECKG